MTVRLHPLVLRHWWDATWNPVGGCVPVSPGCRYCYAPLNAATLQTSCAIPLYQGTTHRRGGRYVFNGRLTVLPPNHPGWRFPPQLPGAVKPLLGPGKPSLLWAVDMADLFVPGDGAGISTAPLVRS